MPAAPWPPVINCLNTANQSQTSGCCSQNSFENIEEPGNDKLAAFRCDLKRLTSLTFIEYCVKDCKFLVPLSFIKFYDILFKNYDFRGLDVNKRSILASKFIILNFKGILHSYVFF